MFGILQEAQGAMRRSDQIDSTHVVLIPEAKIPLNLVVAAMSDGGRFLAVGGRRSQGERKLEPFGGHVRRGEGHPLAGRGVLALLTVSQSTAVKARHFYRSGVEHGRGRKKRGSGQRRARGKRKI